jgi:hypothetical protein
VFETFPLPPITDRLGAAGRSLDEERREIMLRRDLGLTKLYNLLNDDVLHGDRDVSRLREIHVEVDEAATAAYGWDDVDLKHSFESIRQVQRWTIGSLARVELLDRLLLENHRRVEENRSERPTGADGAGPAQVDTLFD